MQEINPPLARIATLGVGSLMARKDIMESITEVAHHLFRALPSTQSGQALLVENLLHSTIFALHLFHLIRNGCEERGFLEVHVVASPNGIPPRSG
jgi:hypothetical protein